MRKWDFFVGIISLAAVILVLTAIPGCGEKHNSDLVIVGTGACEDILQKLAAAYNQTNPGFKVIIPPSIGSAGGIRAVEKDEYLVARVARPKDKPVKDLVYRPFAQDAIVFLTGSEVKVASLTERQIVDIYSEKITDWREVGGVKAPIRLLFREDIDTSLAILRKDFPGFDKLKYNNRMKLIYLDPEMIPVLLQFPTSLGWLTSSSVRPGINVIAIDGVAPTPENLRSGKYRYAIEYAFVFKKGRLDNSAKKFFDFIFSPSGRLILEKNGMVPIARNP